MYREQYPYDCHYLCPSKSHEYHYVVHLGLGLGFPCGKGSISIKVILVFDGNLGITQVHCLHV